MRTASLSILGAVAGALLGAGPAAATPWPEPPPKPPHLIVITSDDQWLSSMYEGGPMKATRRWLGERGATFTQAIASNPVCCPSRASLITGQYSHNNGVLANVPGYPALVEPGNVLPVWLRRAGYRTMHVGKWLNRYGAGAPSLAAVPPGWGEWHSVVTAVKREISYYNYPLRVNGKTKRYGTKRSEYLGHILNTTAAQLLRKHLLKRRPVYLQLDHYAPHGDTLGRAGCKNAAIPDPRDVGSYADAVPSYPPSFNEPDVSDKSDYVGLTEQLNDQRQAILVRRLRCGLASLRSVDRGVARVVRVLKKHGELRNTVIVFMSDNGYEFGEHRLTGKADPYEEALRVPLLIRLPPRLRPGVPDGITIDEPVANIDIVPTLLELADASPCVNKGCRTLDGRSLVPLLRQEPGWPEDRAIVIEYQRKAVGEPSLARRLCAFTGLRTPQVSFVELYVTQQGGDPCPATPQIERYDLINDPYQLDNLFGFPPEEPDEEELIDRLDVLRDCAGVEGRDPLPESGHYCE